MNDSKLRGKFIRVDGSILQRERFRQVQSFQESAEYIVALVSVTAGGVGLNLSAASVAIFVELPPYSFWNAQAEDRVS